MSQLFQAIGAIINLTGQSKRAKGAAAVRSAGRDLRDARSYGNKGDVARAYRNLDMAEEAVARNDAVQARTQSQLDALDQLTCGLSIQSKFCHTISVSVKGGPEASLRRCWYLAIAACFGRRRKGIDAFWAETLNANWDVTGKAVTCTVSYAVGALSDPWGSLNDSQDPIALLQRGPDQVTVGAGWDSFFATLQQQVGGIGVLQNLKWARMIGGKLGLAGPKVPDVAPLPGQVIDPLKKRRLSKDPAVVRQLPPKRDPFIDANLLTVGWRVTKGDNDSLQPIFTALFQPWTVRVITHPLAELPIGHADAGEQQLIPYRSHRPAPLDGIQYIRRGGVLGDVPTLPDEGRIITTGEKLDKRVQPPKPPVDGLSRGHLLMMVSAALADPGVLVVAPKNPAGNTQPLGAEGVYVDLPGTQYQKGEDRYRSQPKILFNLVRNIFVALDQNKPLGLNVPLRADNLRPPTPPDPADPGNGQGVLRN